MDLEDGNNMTHETDSSLIPVTKSHDHKRKFDASQRVDLTGKEAFAMEAPHLPPPRRSKRTRPLSSQEPEVTEMHFRNFDEATSFQPPTPNLEVEQRGESNFRIKGCASTSIHLNNDLTYIHRNHREVSDSDSQVPLRAVNGAEDLPAQIHAPPRQHHGGAGFVGRVASYFVPGSSSSSDEHSSNSYESQSGVGNRLGERSAKHAMTGLERPQHRMARKEQSIRIIPNENELKWKDEMSRLKRDNDRLAQELESNEHNFQERLQDFKQKLQESESEKRQMQDEHETFVREQQEASFRRMESARWLPKQESEVMADLKRLKTRMRNWAKGTSIKDFSLLQVGDEDKALVLRTFSKVVRFEGSQMPSALQTATRGPMLLLNALLTHEVYTSFFKSPFFFLDDKDSGLARVYRTAIKRNEEDAHIWRSQTLRLLMPPEQTNDPEPEKSMRNLTKSMVAKVADRKASEFLAGPAQYLIDPKSNPDLKSKLLKIFTDTASMAYELWTRRTNMHCLTLGNFSNVGGPFFDSESHYFDPDALVRYDDHEDGLKGRLVTMFVHPLLLAYGTDEGKGYENRRVWTKGVAWIDSRMAKKPGEKQGEEMGDQTRKE